MKTNVVNIRPKTMNKKYKQHDFVLTFIPDTKQWKWTVFYVHRTEFSDIADTLNKAQKAAEKHIDRTLQLRGEQ